MDDWLILTCSFCRCRFKIKAAHGHLRGRCPDCGLRIEPVTSKPEVKQSSPSYGNSEEPLGLLPLEDEWPEPPRLLDVEDTSATYGIAGATETPGPIPLQADAGAGPAPASKAEAAPQRPQPRPEKPAAPPKDSRRTLDPADIFGERQTDKAAAPRAPAPARSKDQLPDVDPVELPPAPPSRSEKRSAKPTQPELDIFGEPIIKAEDRPPAATAGRGAPPAPPPPKSPSKDVYSLNDDGPDDLGVTGEVPVVPYRPNDTAFEDSVPQGSPPTRTPLEPTSSYRLSDAELEPERPPPVPARLFWTGVWNFPFQARNILPLIYIALGVAVVDAQIALVLHLLGTGGQMAIVAIGFMALGILWMVIWVGSYQAHCFFGIIQDTAAGNDIVTYPEYDWKVSFFQLLRLAWLAGLAVMLPGLICTWLGFVGYAIWVLVIPATFTVVLMSSLAADSWLKIIDGRVLAGIKEKPEIVPVVYFYTLLLTILCVSASAVVFKLTALFIPINAILWAVAWLMYARLLGRCGYALTHKIDEKKKKRKKKKRKKKPETENARDEADVDGEDESDGDGSEVKPAPRLARRPPRAQK